MKPLEAFVIPVTTLRMGRNQLDFTADWRFFECFEDSPVRQGNFSIEVIFDKFQDHWHLLFEISGEMDTECDRCLAAISLPVEGSHELYVKFDADTEDGPEVVNVPRETTQFNIAQYVYEFVVLSLPLIRTYDCEEDDPRPCDDAMLEKLKAHEDTDTGSQWEALKGLDLSTEEQN